LLFDQALLAEGGQLDDPAGIMKRINETLLTMTLSDKKFKVMLPA
jgi:molecular chaperone HtpG